jgi:hypothetical protein
MMPLLMDEEDGREIVRERVASKEWYLVPGISTVAGQVMAEIEERFYMPGTEANADFEILMGCPYIFSLTMARKSRAPYSEILDLVDPNRTGIRVAPQTVPQEQQDILIMFDEDTDVLTVTDQVVAFFNWVMAD